MLILYKIYLLYYWYIYQRNGWRNRKLLVIVSHQLLREVLKAENDVVVHVNNLLVEKVVYVDWKDQGKYHEK